MPARVDQALCNGCRGRSAAACEHICPADLMAVQQGSGRALNIEPDQCWECFACVKACPETAIEVLSYADLAPVSGRLEPRCTASSISWHVVFRNGCELVFEYPTRTKARGMPFEDCPPPREKDLHSQRLSGEGS